MNGDYQSFLSLPEQQDRRDVLEAVAGRLDTLPSHAGHDTLVTSRISDGSWNNFNLLKPRSMESNHG